MKNTINKKCPFCDKILYPKFFTNHLIECHNLSKRLASIYRINICHNKWKTVPFDVVNKYFNLLGFNDENYIITNDDVVKKSQLSQFISYYDMVTFVKSFNINDDMDYYFSTIRPWKLQHPGVGNCRELCDLMFPNNKEFADKIYEHFMKSKNPFTGHGKELSPFSKDFNGYKNLTDEEKNQKVLDCLKLDKYGRNTTSIDYWLNKGYSEKESKQKLKERQRTFTLEKCIKKYGEEEGYNRWKERQEKWQNTLNSKPLEEIQRINRDKVWKSGAISKIEQQFSSKLVDAKYCNIVVDNTPYIVDILFNGKVIEFYGDYWHCNPQKYK